MYIFCMFNTGLGFWAYLFLGLFTYTCAISEITHLGLLVNFSNYKLVINQGPMIKRFLTLLEAPSLDVKTLQVTLIKEDNQNLLLTGDLQGSCNNSFSDNVVCIVKSYGVLDTSEF